MMSVTLPTNVDEIFLAQRGYSNGSTTAGLSASAHSTMDEHETGVSSQERKKMCAKFSDGSVEISRIDNVHIFSIEARMNRGGRLLTLYSFTPCICFQEHMHYTRSTGNTAKQAQPLIAAAGTRPEGI